MASKSVFISHAIKDRAIADALVDLLTQVSLVRADQIFCSSIEGMDIPKGENFIGFIREQIQSPKLVILLLSPNYLDSTFCLCELGAAWVLAHKAFPLVLPPLTYEDLKAVLTGVQAGIITEARTLNDLKDTLCAELVINVNSARWETKRNSFFKRITEELAKSVPPQKVDYKQFCELEKKYKSAMEELAASEEKISTLGDLIEELKATKDAKDVASVIRAHSTEGDEFDALVDEAKQALSKLSPVVIECLFHDLAGSVYAPNEMDSGTWEDIRQAIANDYLKDNDGICLNDHDPEVRTARDAVSEVSGFLYRCSDEFSDWYTTKYGHQPKIANRRFWSEQFDA